MLLIATLGNCSVSLGIVSRHWTGSKCDCVSPLPLQCIALQVQSKLNKSNLKCDLFCRAQKKEKIREWEEATKLTLSAERNKINNIIIRSIIVAGTGRHAGNSGMDPDRRVCN